MLRPRVHILFPPCIFDRLDTFFGQKSEKSSVSIFDRLFQDSCKSLDVPIASQSLACKARTAGTLSLTEVEAASSDKACSRRNEAAMEPAPSAAVENRQWLVSYTCLQPTGVSNNSRYSLLFL